ncbi:MAG TPA: hypothetical protein VIX14_01620 [Terriglobales bacterium]
MIVSTTEAIRNGKPKSNGTRKGRGGGRRSRNQADKVRYFVGRPGDGDSKPMLEQEVSTEPEALVIAFKSDCRVYFISEYRVTQRIEGSQVRLEKEAPEAVQRVSNLNAS